MRLLFEMDNKDYDPDGEVFRRPSARGIIFRDGRIAVIYSRRYKYCKLPGGGIEDGEDNITAMIREVREETGLIVKGDTVREFGYVHRIQKGKHEPVFIQDNYYYFCEVEDRQEETELSQNEKEADFVPVFITLDEAIRINEEYAEHNDNTMIQRELRVLRLIMEYSAGSR
ncbi:MAG: NUDIX domain-containing protein [Ruminococcus sp.]|nr:NUDIX domain-containing protein [Oscillospiraceae bacterium]MBR1382428.1 NUDIX domain-containing protein [Ruminococcus sp.]